MGAISSDGLFDVTLTVRVAARSEDAACPTCALARTFGASPDDARFDVTCLSCSCGVTTIARQARTIRRLFTAYFLAKGQLKNVNACLAYALERHARLQADVHENVIPESVQAGVDLERARIVAELRARAKYLIDSYGKAQENAAYEIYDLADAIERGEL